MREHTLFSWNLRTGKSNRGQGRQDSGFWQELTWTDAQGTALGWGKCSLSWLGGGHLHEHFYLSSSNGTLLEGTGCTCGVPAFHKCLGGREESLNVCLLGVTFRCHRLHYAVSPRHAQGFGSKTAPTEGTKICRCSDPFVGPPHLRMWNPGNPCTDCTAFCSHRVQVWYSGLRFAAHIPGSDALMAAVVAQTTPGGGWPQSWRKQKWSKPLRDFPGEWELFILYTAPVLFLK